MKKYVFMLLACVALFTSCGDDDNKISIATDFRINPSTVIAPFAAVEHNPGELETFASGYQLRVRLLVYNSEGLLQDEDVQYFSTYSVTMSSSLFLPESDYKAIVVTDVVSENPGEVEYWKLSDYKRLANTHIDDGELIGGRQEILGIATKDFTVGSNSYGEVSIDVQPAGALFFTKYENIHEHDDIGVDFYVLITSKIGHSYVFNSDGSFDASAESSNENIAWTLDRIYPENFEMNVGNVYNYIFVTPFNNSEWVHSRLRTVPHRAVYRYAQERSLPVLLSAPCIAAFCSKTSVKRMLPLNGEFRQRVRLIIVQGNYCIRMLARKPPCHSTAYSLHKNHILELTGYAPPFFQKPAPYKTASCKKTYACLIVHNEMCRKLLQIQKSESIITQQTERIRSVPPTPATRPYGYANLTSEMVGFKTGQINGSHHLPVRTANYHKP